MDQDEAGQETLERAEAETEVWGPEHPPTMPQSTHGLSAVPRFPGQEQGTGRIPVLSPSFSGVVVQRQGVCWDMDFPKANIHFSSGSECRQDMSQQRRWQKQKESQVAFGGVFLLNVVRFDLMEQVWGGHGSSNI